MKSGYVLLLLLATAACTTPQKQPEKSESESVAPLSVIQWENERYKQDLTRPIALPQVEKQLLEEQRITKLEPADPEWQDKLLREMIGLKSLINETKEKYKQAWEEEGKQWVLHDSSFTHQPWWENLPDEQKAYWYAYEIQLRNVLIKHENTILKAWGDEIVGDTKAMEEEKQIVATREELAKLFACLAKKRAHSATHSPTSQLVSCYN